MTTLADIRTKVRRLTGRPSSNQITDGEIDSYVNTFYLYDLPEELRLFSLRSTLSFMTIPNQGDYDLSTMEIPFNGIDQKITDVYTDFLPPLYISGYQSYWSQSRQQFFNIYPQLHQEATLTGDGTTGAYTTTLSNVPVLQGSLTIGVEDNTGAQVQVVDDPQDTESGNLQIINTTDAVSGSINYLTGALSVTFSNAITSGETIYITWVPYSGGRPQGALFYDNVITLRPVPTQAWEVTLDAFILPTALISSSQSPEIKQWWQLLAYGAAKKIFEDASDPEAVATIMPEMNKQERLVIRRSLVQQSTQRTATIYSEMQNFPYGNGGGYNSW